jgi:hypothetical protein
MQREAGQEPALGEPPPAHILLQTFFLVADLVVQPRMLRGIKRRVDWTARERRGPPSATPKLRDGAAVTTALTSPTG